MFSDLNSTQRVHLEWGSLSKWLEDEIESLRQLNDGDQDPIATAKIRGQILALKKVLALPEAARGDVAGPA